MHNITLSTCSYAKYCIAENIGEFGKLMANHQSFLSQIYKIFNMHILFVVDVIKVGQRGDVFPKIFSPY